MVPRAVHDAARVAIYGPRGLRGHARWGTPRLSPMASSSFQDIQHLRGLEPALRRCIALAKGAWLIGRDSTGDNRTALHELLTALVVHAQPLRELRLQGKGVLVDGPVAPAGETVR